MQQIHKRPISWKRNLAVIWLAQSLTVIGFTFTFPFMPLFVQELGIPGGGQASLWAGILQVAMGIAMVLSSPVWGLASDRYGRKKNVLRAMFGGALFHALAAFSTSVYHLLVFRALTGLTSGAMGPSMALVASTTPRERLSFSLGILQTAFFVGNTVGPLIGGLVADAWGLQGTFLVSGAILTAAALILLLFAREDFQRSPQSVSIFQRQAYADLLRLLTSRELLPVFATIFILQLFPIMAFTVLPVILESLSPASGGSITGVAFSVMGVTGALGSYIAGWLTTRVGLMRILTATALGAGLSFSTLFFVDSVAQFLLFLAIAGAFQGGMVAISGALVGLTVTGEHQGAAFGGLQAVQVAAFSIGPFAGGVIAVAVALRWVFLVQAVGLLTVPLAARRLLSGRLGEQKQSVADRTAQPPTGSDSDANS